MKAHAQTVWQNRLNERLATTGLRFTPHREQVYDILLRKRDHPTADEVFLRAKQAMPEISMATVYNCLDALVQCGLVRQVNLDPAAMRFCPNMHEHCHFYCEDCGGIYDIELPGERFEPGLEMPKGFRAHHYEVAIRGTCPACGARSPKRK